MYLEKPFILPFTFPAGLSSRWALGFSAPSLHAWVLSLCSFREIHSSYLISCTFWCLSSLRRSLFIHADFPSHLFTFPRIRIDWFYSLRKFSQLSYALVSSMAASLWTLPRRSQNKLKYVLQKSRVTILLFVSLLLSGLYTPQSHGHCNQDSPQPVTVYFLE